jgi:hypothetical protein
LIIKIETAIKMVDPRIPLADRKRLLFKNKKKGARLGTTERLITWTILPLLTRKFIKDPKGIC